MKHINFLKKALTDYRVGAITISSRFVVKKILADLPAGARNIVEYGPGNGVITGELLKALPPNGKLVAIELNKEFCKELREKITDPRFELVEGSISDLSNDFAKFGIKHADAVISGVPFTLFSPKVREEVVSNTHRGLRDGGAFIVYQYSPLIRPILRKFFKKVSSRLEPLNLPPYFIMRAEK